MINKKELESLLSNAEKIIDKKEQMAKDCVLSLLYFKYINDIYNWHVKRIKEQFAGDERSIKGRINRLPLAFSEDSLFDYFYKNVSQPNITEIVKNGMSKFVNSGGNTAWLASIFTAINLDYVAGYYLETLKTDTLRKLIETFNAYDLSGKEEYDLFNTAFYYMNGWKFSFESFRDYVGM